MFKLLCLITLYGLSIIFISLYSSILCRQSIFFVSLLMVSVSLNTAGIAWELHSRFTPILFTPSNLNVVQTHKHWHCSHPQTLTMLVTQPHVHSVTPPFIFMLCHRHLYPSTRLKIQNWTIHKYKMFFEWSSFCFSNGILKLDHLNTHCI